MVNILIAEDEEILRKGLTDKLKKYWSEANIIASVECGTDALEALNNLKPDVAFLDIKMGGLTGIEVIQQASHHCHVVFVTAYDEYAIKAFDTGAIDYLLKPYSDKRLQECITRLTTRLTSVPLNLKNILSKIEPNKKQYLKRLKIQIGNKMWLISVDDIICLKAFGRYVKVLTNEREALVRMPLKNLYEQLNPDSFWQIHRSAVINIGKLDHVNSADSEQMQVHMQGMTDPIIISRSFSHLFRNINL